MGACMVERFDLGFGLDPDESGGALMALAQLRERRATRSTSTGACCRSTRARARGGASAWTMRPSGRTGGRSRTCCSRAAACRCRAAAAARRARRRRGGRFTIVSARAWRLSARTVLLNTGGGGRWAQKKWTPEHYRRFARLVRREEPDTAVLLAGGPEEVSLNRGAARVVRRRGDHRRGMRELAEAVRRDRRARRSRRHLRQPRAAHGVRAVAAGGGARRADIAVGARDVRQRGSRTARVPCLACYRPQCDKPLTCMELLTPQDVYEACARVAAPAARASRCNLGA